MKVYLTEQEAAAYFEGLGVNYAAATLRNHRVSGKGPPFVTLGRRIRYRKEELDKWLDNRPSQTSTSARG